MKFKLKSFLVVMLLVPFWSYGQVNPLPVDQNTVGLWNFDTDVDDQVVDQGADPVTGTAYTTENLAVPQIDASFGLGRKFTTQSSFIDLGVVQGSKLDFTGWNELSIEAIVHLNQSAPSDHIVFSSENVRLMIVNNQLAAFIRQPGGLLGLVSDRTLYTDTTYRIGLHYRNRRLVLTINGRVDASITLDYDIQAPQFSSNRASIGGDLFGRFMPGFIDDVRVRNIAGIDMTNPEIELVEPSSFQVTSAKPHFLLNLTDDDSGVDVSSIEVYLNGIQQQSLVKTQSQISGFMDDEFLTTVLNEVKVSIVDNAGNRNEKVYYFTFSSILDRQEYVTDSNTLALWHMNDFAPGYMKDDSGNDRDGYGNTTYIKVGEGVFGQGRQFTRGGLINFDSIRLSNQQFTLEAWFRPVSNYYGEEILFYNGQLKVARVNEGIIRVILYTTRGTVSYQSSESLLPVNELHHLAVTWDGSKTSKNLTFYVDGTIKGQLDAIANCDFDHIPKLGIIGEYYEGLIDEMRFSDTVRSVFSIPVFDNQVINFLSLKNGTSVNSQYPEFHATLNASGSVNLSTLKILLNNQVESASANLLITQTGIDGTFSRPLQEGINHIEISFLDNQGNHRKKSQYFYYIKKVGSSEYSPEPTTSALWHFNETVSGNFADSSGNGNHFVSYGFTPVPGVIGNGVKGYATVTGKQPLNCRSFTVEGFFKATEAIQSFRQVYSLNGAPYSQFIHLNPSNGNLRLNINNYSNPLDIEIPQAFPVDNAFHHLAFVYDSSRPYSQVLLIVDGVVKRALDYHNSCDFNGTVNIDLGDTYLVSDEVRISKVAKYSFNIQDKVSDRPILISSSISNKATVNIPNQTYTFRVSDADGISSSKTKLYLNGVEVQVNETNSLAFDLVAEFTANVVLSSGENTLLIRTEDMKGNEQVFVQKVNFLTDK